MYVEEKCIEELKIQWHPAFCSAMELILEEDKKYLEFIREYNLNTKPLQVDLLVIKKAAGYIVKDKIGKIFQEHNIFEYKSPDDEMNIDTFYKVNAYAALYKASARHVDEIKADRVTITMLREGKPIKLLQNLESYGFTIENPYKGIYYIGGRTYFPTQIIVSKELTGEQYVWLQALTKKLDQAKAERLIRQAKNSRSQENQELEDSVLTVSVRANPELFGKVKEDVEMSEALLELMANEINERVAMGEKRGEIRGERRGAIKGLQALVDILKNMGLDFETAYQSIIKTEAYAGIPREQIMEYWR